MIDIHTHLLPGVDDGPGNFNESLEILRGGVLEGIHGVVCTSHVLENLTPELEKKYIEKFLKLKELAAKEGLGISLWLASEIMSTANFDFHSPIATFNNNGKYLLIEFPMAHMPSDVGEIFFNLNLEGVHPILAHPERNAVIMQKPQVVYEFINRGVLMQINSGSIAGAFGRRPRETAMLMLEHNLVHFVASDCHNPASRPMSLKKSFSIINDKFGKERAENLFMKNPAKAVAGEEIDIGDPQPVKSRQGGFLSLFRKR
ncbi:hypothetical protein J7K93_12450 [bacterium]|nr:hypothetical protein [bacterium]